MASSSLSMRISEAKRRVLDLEKIVKDFERLVREKTERTKQSIDQLSMDCESNCIKVWQTFDAFMEETRLKAGELCDEMRRKTSEQQSKWRLSLQEKENLLKEAGMWRNNLRHLLGTGNDDEKVVCVLQSVGAKLSSRLHESFAPAEEGYLVVTFPEWCHQSLNQLKEEMVDFTVETSRNLELQIECSLQYLNLNIFSIVGSDDDGHVFVVDGDDRSIKEFAESGEVVSRYPFSDEGEKFFPSGICRLSEDILVICGPLWSGSRWRGRLLFLARKRSPPFLKRQKKIDREESLFYSLCQMDEQIFACDSYFKEIFCFSKNGKKIKTIQIEGLLGLDHSSDPILRADLSTGTLWGTRRGMSEIFVFNQNGQILRTVQTEEEITDFCGDGFGHFYFSTQEGIFSVLPKKILFKFPKISENLPNIFVSPEKLFVCFQNDGENLMKIFKIR